MIVVSLFNPKHASEQLAPFERQANLY